MVRKDCTADGCNGTMRPTRHYVRWDCMECDNWEGIPPADETSADDPSERRNLRCRNCSGSKRNRTPHTYVDTTDYGSHKRHTYRCEQCDGLTVSGWER